jgi:hypothetical protein
MPSIRRRTSSGMAIVISTREPVLGGVELREDQIASGADARGAHPSVFFSGVVNDDATHEAGSHRMNYAAVGTLDANKLWELYEGAPPSAGA